MPMPCIAQFSATLVIGYVLTIPPYEYWLESSMASISRSCFHHIETVGFTRCLFILNGPITSSCGIYSWLYLHQLTGISFLYTSPNTILRFFVQQIYQLQLVVARVEQCWIAPLGAQLRQVDPELAVSCSRNYTVPSPPCASTRTPSVCPPTFPNTTPSTRALATVPTPSSTALSRRHFCKLAVWGPQSSHPYISACSANFMCVM